MTLAATLVQTCHAAMLALGRELAAWKPSRERAAFAMEAVLSVALSVALAHALHLSYTWWAAISGFAVMQTSFGSSVERAVHRVIGTLLGAALGALVGPLIGDRPWLFVPALGVIGGVAAYYANGSKAPYAWMLGGVTALMVTYEAHQLTSLQATAVFAALRASEVMVGTLACLLVASVFHFGPQWYRRLRPPPASATPFAIGEGVTAAQTEAPPSPDALLQNRKLLGAQAALAIGILAACTYWFDMPGFAQAMVTAIAVLILPAGKLVDRTRQPIIEKMVQRVAGCLLAGAVGLALLPLMHGQPVWHMLVLSLGVWVGCHVQSGQQGASYVGRQFTIAFIMVFVQDHQWEHDPTPALMRLSGILAGIVVLAAVMLAMSVIAHRKRQVGAHHE